jgi:hypothetical protein
VYKATHRSWSWENVTGSASPAPYGTERGQQTSIGVRSWRN